MQSLAKVYSEQRLNSGGPFLSPDQKVERWVCASCYVCRRVGGTVHQQSDLGAQPGDLLLWGFWRCVSRHCLGWSDTREGFLSSSKGLELGPKSHGVLYSEDFLKRKIAFSYGPQQLLFYVSVFGLEDVVMVPQIPAPSELPSRPWEPRGSPLPFGGLYLGPRGEVVPLRHLQIKNSPGLTAHRTGHLQEREMTWRKQ